jgi:ABC-2 type transport system permease protein
MKASAYMAVVAARFKVLLQYRIAALAGFTTQLFWGFIKIMVFVAFYEATTNEPPMSFAQVLVYIWLGQAMLSLLPWNVDAEIAGHIRTGGVAYELLRPLDLYGFWFARTIAYRSAPTLLRMLPMLIFSFLILPLVGFQEWALPPPADGASLALFAVSLLATLILATAITMVMHVSLIWTVSGEGFNRLMPGIVPIFSGLTIPLPLFPDWMQTFLYWQPFRGAADVPLRIYSGHIPASDAGFEILLQLGWAGVIALFGYWLLARGRSKLVVQGG